ncbi:MAG: DUF6644 family protein [Gemmatimonadaceae bacterium]
MLLPFFEWCEATALGQFIRDSLWLFPVIEAGHLLALCVLGGALLVVDLRMLGFGVTRQSIAQLAGTMRPLVLGALTAMVLTGVSLFLSEAVKCYHNPSFWVKMTVLPIALLFTFLVRQRVARDPSLETSLRSRLVASVSLGLWFTVAAAGRWIGFSS